MYLSRPGTKVQSPETEASVIESNKKVRKLNFLWSCMSQVMWRGWRFAVCSLLVMSVNVGSCTSVYIFTSTASLHPCRAKNAYNAVCVQIVMLAVFAPESLESKRV